jgi:uncharacterized cupin superfamily protein
MSEHDKNRRHPNVVNIADLEPRAVSKGTRFGFTSKRLATACGARGIGASWYEVPPGRTAFPFHYHCANEEAIYVLEGKGSLRIGKDTIEIGPGDWVTFPIGPDSAHQLANTGTAPLRYLCLSTMNTTEVVGYPDSKKVAAMSVESPGSMTPLVRGIFKAEAQVDYYEGEPID